MADPEDEQIVGKSVDGLLTAIAPEVLLAVAVMLLSIVSALHALLHKRDPRAALGWIVFCIAVPVVGAISYYLLGINRIKATASRLRRASGIDMESVSVTERAEHSRDDRISGNVVLPLFDGEAAYPAMLEAIRAASETVLLSQYIFEPQGIGGEFVDALGAAAHSGVNVHVLIDGVGDLYAWGSIVRILRKRGVDVVKFLPLRLLPPALHLNLRNHRKILAVDCSVAFVGGMNIRNACITTETAESPAIKDVNFALRGPIVADIESTFRDDWYFATGIHLTTTEPVVTLMGDAVCRLTIDGPDNATDILSLRIQAAISLAKWRVRLQTPYFLPTREIIGALQTAVLRGVEVEVVLPSRSNLPYVHWATRNMLWELLQYGVRVYYQAGSFDHSKLLIADDNYCLIGSANIDPRSLRLNFEIGVEVWSDALAASMNQHLDEILGRSSELTLTEADGRSLVVRIRDSAAWLISPYL